MRAGWKQTGAAVVVGMTILSGCDNAQYQADKQVNADLAQARQMAAASSDGTKDAAHRKIEEAAQNQAASAGPRAIAKAARAQAELDVANDMLRKVDEGELSIARLAAEIAQLSSQIRTSGAAIASYRRFDPKPARDAIATKILEAQGAPDKPAWFTNGKAVIPTLSAIQVDLTRIQAELAQKQQQAASLMQQRTQKLDQAEQLAAQSDQQRGEESVSTFRRAADLRKQAGDVAVEMDKLNNEINRLQKDLAVAQAQQTAINDVVAQLQDQARTLDQGWKDLEAQAAAHQKLSAQILGTAGLAPSTGSAVVGGSIQQKAAELDRLVKEVQKLRTEVQEKLGNITTLYEGAYGAGNELVVELRGLISNPSNKDRGELAAWQTMIKAIEPMQFRLQQAAAHRMLGDLYSSEASSQAARMSLRDSLQTALGGTGLSAPAELMGSDTPQARQTALTNADAAYKAASDLYETIVTAPMSREAEGIQNAARVSAALNSYAWAQVARQQGKQAQVTERIQAAKNHRDEAAGRNVALPILPAELGAPPKPAAAETPATQPA